MPRQCIGRLWCSGPGRVRRSGRVVLPAVLSPVIAALVAACGTWLLYRITRSLTDGARKHGFRIGQIGSACVVSLVDRLVHNAEIVAIDGESYRLKEAHDRTEQRARRRRGAKS